MRPFRLLKLAKPPVVRQWPQLCQVQLQAQLHTTPNLFQKNFHRPDNGSSNDASEAADAAPTVLAERTDLLKLPNKVTWVQALQEREKQLAEGKILDSYSYVDPVTYEVGEKTRSESFTFLTLPFKDDPNLCDLYVNAAGRLRAGQLFQDLDALAGRIAYRHCSPAEPVNVTASVDRIYMVKKVDEISNYNFVLAGSVTWTGRSSMEITVKGYSFDESVPETINESTLPAENVFLSANFTFVARNPITHKSFAINRLLPITENEWLDYRKAESHNAKKKLAAKEKNFIEPTTEEFKAVYEMWKNWKSFQKNTNVLPANNKFMNESSISSTLIMQPQYRNRHSYMIFGGYLLRQTFELAYCASSAFLYASPRFVSLDSTTFKNPVPVGSVLSMNATIVYTEHLHSKNITELDPDSPFDFFLPPTNKVSPDLPGFLNELGTLIQVKVDTTTRELQGTEVKEAGSFIYSFFVPLAAVEGEPKYPTVIPRTYTEMMDYIEGRRRAEDTAHYVQTLNL